MRPAGRMPGSAAAAIAAVAGFLVAADARAHAAHAHGLGPGAIEAELAAADREQEQHEFADARRRLDRILASDPRNVRALLMRSSISTVLGDFASARRDCGGVIEAGLAFPGTICLAAALTGPGSLGRARGLMNSLDGTPAGSAEIDAWRLATAADLALRDDAAPEALALLERAYSLMPESEELRSRLAGLLLEQGQAARALELVSASKPSIAGAIVGARAARLLGHRDAPRLRQEAESLLQRSRHERESAHDREEALVALHLAGDAALALRHARRNFDLQKDTTDLRVLLDSALAAGDPASLAVVSGWLAASGFEDRVVSGRLAEAIPTGSVGDP